MPLILKNAGQALDDVYGLIPLAKQLKAEILITHIAHEKSITYKNAMPAIRKKK